MQTIVACFGVTRLAHGERLFIDAIKQDRA
jgi:hypothetical protein